MRRPPTQGWPGETAVACGIPQLRLAGRAGCAEDLQSTLCRGYRVFFDQSELRGGDAWDQKIRREIESCALFIPVISSKP